MAGNNRDRLAKFSSTLNLFLIECRGINFVGNEAWRILKAHTEGAY